MTQPTFNGPTALVLRCCRADFTSYGGFQWPSEIGAQVIAPDWSDDTNCGHGLHGWLYGAGDHACSDYWSDKDSKWLVVEVEESSIRVIGGKCKFPRCIVRFIGTRSEAADYIAANEPRAASVAIIGRVGKVGDSGVAQVGALGSLTGGDSSTLTGGYSSTLTGGDSSTLTGGYSSTLTGGDSSTLTGGDSSTLTGGNYSTLTGGDSSTLTGGDGSELRFKYWDDKARRYRTKLAYVGEDGIEANVAYRLNEKNEVVRAAALEEDNGGRK